MKLLGFRQKILKRWRILKSNTVYTSRESLAYSANNWGSLISTMSYIATYLVFIEAIFNKTETVASYNQNEMLFLTVIGQTAFLIIHFFSFVNVKEMTELVKTGGMDLLLLKPLPHLFYVSIKKIDLPTTALNLITSVTPPLVYLIIKGGVKLSISNLGTGIWVAIMGMVCVHCFQFILNLVIFWQAKAKSISRISYDASHWGMDIPFEGFPQLLKTIFLTIIPSLIPVGLAVSIMLGKNSFGWQWGVYSTLVTIIFVFLKSKMWQRALLVYQSASS